MNLYDIIQQRKKHWIWHWLPGRYIHVCTFQLYLLASVFTSSAPIDCSCLHEVSHDRFYPILLDPPRSHLVPEKYLLILVYFVMALECWDTVLEV